MDSSIRAMESEALEGLLKAIRDAVAVPRSEDVALPTFDPDKNDNGAEGWCKNVETIAADLGWSSVTTVAKAGKALKGSALVWFETWEPDLGRTWEQFKTDIKDLYPEKRNLTEKMLKAIGLTSEASESYCEYAREKLRLLAKTKVAFTQEQLVELVCGGIHDVHVQMAAHNSRAKNTAELMYLFTTYVKSSRKRSHESNSNSKPSSSDPIKRPRLDNPREVRCFICHETGHVRSQCVRNFGSAPFRSTSIPQTNKIQCSFCQKLGHTEAVCFNKQRAATDTQQAKSST